MVWACLGTASFPSVSRHLDLWCLDSFTIQTGWLVDFSMTKAFSYLRVSGLGQVNGDGFERQREAVQNHARAHGLEIVQEFRDEGISGTSELEDRPGLASLVAAIESNGVRTVLVERSDRLARDLMIGEVLLARFRKSGVKVIEAEGGTDLTVEDGEPTKVLIRQILGCIAQFEKSMIVSKLRAARMRKRSRGERCEGGKPFGQKEGERMVLDRIRDMREHHMTIEEIADHLNKDFTPTRKKDARWHATTVARILRRAA